MDYIGTVHHQLRFTINTNGKWEINKELLGVSHVAPLKPVDVQSHKLNPIHFPPFLQGCGHAECWQLLP